MQGKKVEPNSLVVNTRVGLIGHPCAQKVKKKGEDSSKT